MNASGCAGRSGWKRGALLAAGYAAAGIAVTVAVSWALALWVPVSGGAMGSVVRITSVRPRSPAHGEGAGWLSITKFSTRGAWFAESYVQPAEGEGSTPEEPSPGAVTPEKLVPMWAFAHLTPRRPEDWPDADSTWTAMIDARGWPLPALWCSYTHETDAAFRVVAVSHGAIEMGGKSVQKGAWAGTYPAALPLRVWWPGLVVNSALAAAVLMVLVHGPRRVRRWRWARSGRCVGCGYDLSGGRAGEVCPECGGGGPRTLLSENPARV